MVEDTKTTIPEDIIQGLILLAESSKTPKATILAEFKEIVANNPDIQAMEQKEHKIRFAYAVLLNRYTSTGGVKQMYLKPLSPPRARKVKSQGTMKYVGNIAALVKLIEKDENDNIVKGKLIHAAGTLWENAAEAATHLSPDKVYKTTLRAIKIEHGIELGGNDASFVETDEEFPSNKDYFEKHVKPKLDSLLVRLGDLELNSRDDVMDIRVIKAMVLDAGTGETADKVEYGRYTVTDDSLIGREEGGPANYSVWVHPSEIVWDNGSTLYFIGSVNYDEKAQIARFDSHFVIPTEVALRKQIKPKAVETKEEVSMEDLDAELDEEHKKVEGTLTDDEFAL